MKKTTKKVAKKKLTPPPVLPPTLGSFATSASLNFPMSKFEMITKPPETEVEKSRREIYRLQSELAVEKTRVRELQDQAAALVRIADRLRSFD